MAEPIDFHAPISPFPRHGELSSFSNNKSVSGQKLFDQASELYAWYGSWDNFPCDHVSTYEHLSTIMLLARTHMRGGNYIKDLEEEKAYSLLIQLRHELYLGNKTHKEIPESLDSIIKILTEENAKAKLVALAIKLDYRIRLHPFSQQTPEVEENIKKILDSILCKVTPDLTESKAQAVAQGLSKVLEKVSAINSASAEEIIRDLNEAMGQWPDNESLPFSA
jgi:hypothetical protein